MISFRRSQTRFNYRMAGVCYHNGRVLLHRFPDGKYWFLPGGRAELMETSEETIIRELIEETGYTVVVKRPIWFVENFYASEVERMHELSMIYEIEFTGQDHPLDKDEFYGREGETLIIFRWFTMEELGQIPIRPAFLKEGLQNPPQQLKHIVNQFD